MYNMTIFQYYNYGLNKKKRNHFSNKFYKSLLIIYKIFDLIFKELIKF